MAPSFAKEGGRTSALSSDPVAAATQATPGTTPDNPITDPDGTTAGSGGSITDPGDPITSPGENAASPDGNAASPDDSGAPNSKDLLDALIGISALDAVIDIAPLSGTAAFATFDGTDLGGTTVTKTFSDVQGQLVTVPRVLTINATFSEGQTNKRVVVRFNNALGIRTAPGMVADATNEWVFSQANLETTYPTLKTAIAGATWTPDTKFQGGSTTMFGGTGTLTYDIADGVNVASIEIRVGANFSYLVTMHRQAITRTNPIQITSTQGSSNTTVQSAALDSATFPAANNGGVGMGGWTGNAEKILKPDGTFTNDYSFTPIVSGYIGALPVFIPYFKTTFRIDAYDDANNVDVFDVTNLTYSLSAAQCESKAITLTATAGRYMYYTMELKNAVITGSTTVSLMGKIKPAANFTDKVASYQPLTPYIDTTYPTSWKDPGNVEYSLTTGMTSNSYTYSSPIQVNPFDFSYLNIAWDRPDTYPLQASEYTSAGTDTNDTTVHLFAFNLRNPESNAIPSTRTQTFEYDFSDTENKVGVQALSLYKNNTFYLTNIEATTMDGSIYTRAAISGTRIALEPKDFRLKSNGTTVMPANAYLKTLKYEMRGDFAAGYIGESYSYNLNVRVFGQVISGADSFTYQPKVRLIQPDISEVPEAQRNVLYTGNYGVKKHQPAGSGEVSIGSELYAAFGNQQGNTTLAAGDTVTNAYIDISSARYNYSAPNNLYVVRGVTWYLREAGYLDYDSSKFKVTWNGNTYIQGDGLEVVEGTDNKGFKFWKVSAPNVLFSYLQDSTNISICPAAVSPRLTFDYTVKKAITTGTVKKQDLWTVSGYKNVRQISHGDRTYSDVHGLSGYSSFYMGVSSLNLNVNFNAIADVIVTTSARLVDKTTGAELTGWTAYDYLKPDNNILNLNPVGKAQYRVNITNAADAVCTEFAAMIPIPKYGESVPGKIPEGDAPFSPAQHMQKEPFGWTASIGSVVSVPEGFTATYATSYVIDRNSSEWKAWSDITNKDNIKMVKIEATGTIAQNFTQAFTFDMNISDTDPETHAGNMNLYAGWYYAKADPTVDGAKTTEPVALRLQTGVVKGNVFNDLDRNGLKGGSETGKSDVVVVAYAHKATQTFLPDDIIEQIVTDASGNYGFYGLSKSQIVDVRFNNPGTLGDTLRFSPVTVNGSTPTMSADKTYGLTSNITPSGTNYDKIDAGFISPVNIVFNYNYTSGGQQTITKYPGDTIAAADVTAPTRANCAFDGWWTQASGGEQITLGSQTAGTANTTTYYAHWKDNTAPVTMITPLSGSWVTALTGQVTLSATDVDALQTNGVGTVASTKYKLNGGDETTYSAAITVPNEGDNTIEYWSTDVNNNVETHKTATIKRDTVNPNTLIVGWTTENQWVSATHQFSLTPTDATSGISKTYYRIDGDAQSLEDYTEYTTAFTLAGKTAGAHTIYYYSVDVAGNVETVKSVAVNLDTDGPTTTISKTTGDWVNPTTQITLSAIDSGQSAGNLTSYYRVSTADSGEYTQYNSTNGITLTDKAAGEWYISYYSIDGVGNKESAHSITVKLDTQAPSTTIAPAANTWLNAGTQITLSAIDPGTGNAQSNVNNIYYKIDSGNYSEYTSGTTVITLGALDEGSHTVSYYATDNAGNAETPTVATFHLDKTAPTAQVQYDTSALLEFLNTVTFGRFFKNTVNVAITATDNTNGSGVGNVYYYTSTAAIETPSTIPNANWISGASFTQSSTAKLHLYVKVTDNAGNAKYYQDGVVVYTDSTQNTPSISFTRQGPSDVTANVNLNGNTIREIKNGASTLTPTTHYTVSGNTITFNASYLRTLDANAAGSPYTLTIAYNPQGEAYTSGGGINEEPLTTTITLNVVKMSQTALTITPPGIHNYGDAPYQLETTGGNGGGAVTFEQTSGTAVATVATDTGIVTIHNAGTFTVKARKAADADYSAGADSEEITVTIGKKQLTITGGTVTPKAYDGTTTATVSAVTFSGLVTGETLTIGTDYTVTDAQYNSANVDATTVSAIVTLVSGGPTANNYSLASGTLTQAAAITPKPLTITGGTVTPKAYDGTTTATVSAVTFSGLVTGETLTIGTDYTVTDAAYNGKDVTGANAATTVSAIVTLADTTDANNYSLLNGTLTQAAAITPKLLTAADLTFTAEDKVYDSTTVAAATVTITPGAIISADSDHLAVSVSAVFADKNANTGKTVSITNWELTGMAAGNYSLPEVRPTTTANITPAPVTVSGAAIENKIYDGTTVASISGGTLSVRYGSDDVAIKANTGTAAFNTKDVGTNKPVTFSGYQLEGNDAANYALSQPAATTANITAKPLTLSGAAITPKTYDGTTTATVSAVTFDGLVTGETLTIGTDYTVTDAQYNSANVDATTVSATVALVLGETIANNYSLQSGNLSVPAQISRAWITATYVQYGGTNGKVTTTAIDVTFTNDTLASIGGFTVDAVLALTGATTTGAVTQVGEASDKKYRIPISLDAGTANGGNVNITLSGWGNYAIQPDFTQPSLVMVYRPVPMATPTAAIDYVYERLTGLVPGNYVFKHGNDEYDNQPVAADGFYSLENHDAWMDGGTLQIKRKAEGATVDSAVQELALP
ncbi:MAG: YDG domain-containing protein, partial [Clostridiales Family XIII bacterium]|nr:YDG domain-containing protein [Clostridiales Family XIII bacterium]